jgi:hypothetical protein
MRTAPSGKMADSSRDIWCEVARAPEKIGWSSERRKKSTLTAKFLGLQILFVQLGRVAFFVC